MLQGLKPSLALTARMWQAPGCAARAGELARNLQWRSVALITDAQVRRLPVYEAVRASFEACEIETLTFDAVTSDPPTAMIEAALTHLRGPNTDNTTNPAYTIDAVVSIGGGSSIDTAKALAALLADNTSVDDLLAQAPTRALPHLAIPTTAGTGAEASNSTILTDASGRKRAIMADVLPPAYVLLDPDVLIGQPRGLLIACGLDALSHGLESLVSQHATQASRMLSRETIRLVSDALPRLLSADDVAAPTSLPARTALQLGAHLGGAALRHARLGYAHAIAHAAAEHCAIAHGLLVIQAIPTVVEFNRGVASADAAYGEAARVAGFTSIDALLAAMFIACDIAPSYRSLALDQAQRASIVTRCVAGPFHQWNPRRADATQFATLLDTVCNA